MEWYWYVLIAVVLVLVIVLIVKSKSKKPEDLNPLLKYVGLQADVTETISDTLETGKVRVDGMVVRAKKGGPGIIDVGHTVTIKKAEDTAFIVQET